MTRSYSWGSTASPLSSAKTTSTTSWGRGRLPTWVVRMRPFSAMAATIYEARAREPDMWDRAQHDRALGSRVPRGGARGALRERAAAHHRGALGGDRAARRAALPRRSPARRVLRGAGAAEVGERRRRPRRPG